MKKTYICPQTEAITLETEGVMAMSIKLNDDTTTSGQWSEHKGGWNSTDWTEANNDDAE